MSEIVHPKNNMTSTHKCNYSVKYVNENHGTQEWSDCKHEPLEDKEVCCYHDKEYHKNNKASLMEKLEKYLTESKEKDADLIDCIGYNIPEEFVLGCTEKPLEFQQHVNFTRAIFHAKATFQSNTFKKNAIFSYSTFKGVAIFSSNTFEGEALFSNTHFKSKVEFKGKRKEQGGGESRNRFERYANFYQARFDQQTDFSGIQFLDEKYNGKKTLGNFSHVDFAGEVDFDSSGYGSAMFPWRQDWNLKEATKPAITFNDTTFRKRSRFKGDASKELQTRSSII